MGNYRLAAGADIIGTTEMGVVEVAPAELVQCFGPPAQADGYKMSGQYVFEDEQGQVFVIHDWKSTSLWEPDYPSPEEFWSLSEPVEFSISTKDLQTGDFEAWLAEQLETP